MRWSTAATLGALALIGGFLQLLLGTDGADGLRLAALVVATIAAVVLALSVIPLLLQPAVGASARHGRVVSLLTVACVTWALALIPPFAGWAWGFLLAIAGGLLSCIVYRFWSAVVLATTLGAIGLGGSLASVGPDAFSVGSQAAAGSDLVVVSTLVVMTFMPLSAVWALRVVLRLDDARRMASELAVATERLRFATDLHDIQGHHLQVIALKGELAERRLHAGQPALAAAELADIRTIAQAALEDTRAVVNDYRTVTVAVEARNAAAVLRSAGISCEARIAVPDLPTPVGAVFALAIREAATNILRHSRATVASLELVRTGADEYRLTVANDGAGATRAGGTGLSGLTERLAAWQGTVEAGRRDDTFTLVVRIPAGAEPHRVEAEAGAER
ncbi:histidine kinase [Herbiconiux sp. 11R-BC]|uniref:sensor histidine kinase n=1 Tax=Herbiconiux sp. 11R-BC TaxID=3111637 RepID=UPI003C10AF99